MARPELLDRQWWLLNAFSYGKPARLPGLFLHGGYESEQEFVLDVRELHKNELIGSAAMDKVEKSVVVKPTQRGRAWARKWRKSQVELATSLQS